MAVVAGILILITLDTKPYLGLALFACALAVVPIARALGQHLRGYWSRSWPLIDARFENGRVVHSPGRGGKYTVDLTYSYRAENSVRIGTYNEAFRNETDANHLLSHFERYPFRVRVDPRNPDRSVLLPNTDF